MRSDSLPGCSTATTSSSESSSVSCCLDVLLEGLSYAGSGRKKSGPGPLLDTAGTKKLELSIARSCAASGCGARSTRSRIESAIASFDGLRDGGLAGRVDQRDRVLLALEADRRVGDVVEDDQVGALALELGAGALDASLAVLGGEADDRLVLAAAGGEAGEDVLGRLEAQLERALAG